LNASQKKKHRWVNDLPMLHFAEIEFGCGAIEALANPAG